MARLREFAKEVWRQRPTRLGALLLSAAMVLLVASLACTDENGARRILTNQGYVDIRMTGYRAWSCGKDYSFHTGFSANRNDVGTDSAGRPIVVRHSVSGAVCSGWMKGYSIKLD